MDSPNDEHNELKELKELHRLIDELIETNADLRERLGRYEREPQHVTVRPVYGVRFGRAENGSAA